LNDSHEHHYHHEHAGHDHHMGHAHSHGHLGWALLLTLGFAAVEAAAGWWAGSLALLGDAGHMVTDASALGLAALAGIVARGGVTRRHSFGLGRIEVLAAAVNALFMLAIVTSIVIGAVQRLQTPTDVDGPVVALVAALGLGINLVVLWTLSHGHQDMNTRGAILHVMGDLLGSVAALASGLIIWATGWLAIDPILSLVICVVILISSIRLLREALHVFMEGVPRHLNIEEVGEAMAATEQVCSVHDLHIWNLSSQEVALSAHVVLRNMDDWQAVLRNLQAMLQTRFGIGHATLQPELPQEVRIPVSELRGPERH